MKDTVFANWTLSKLLSKKQSLKFYVNTFFVFQITLVLISVYLISTINKPALMSPLILLNVGVQLYRNKHKLQLKMVEQEIYSRRK
ncbi:hypothetical protein [Flectobacillus roseus]|uniref:Uncharacterized protein n=1 Tax=Flectobacillus roseus TaxID=502259 RepID=A0ABT6Y821_9BACT|nr:hypothetical protein [Flectobacillus roseus]MDI9859727.1 hypothetical protein [Flectobacillus roseus]